ncbi:MAG: universal stress protein [Acidiferrobacteraceae bacterium]
MYRCILLCYNGTLEGRRVLKEGAELARRFDAETHLLAISRIGTGALAADAPLPNLKDAIAQILDEGVVRLRGMGLAATGHLAFGEPVTEIDTCARRIQADLIVVGHRQRGALARWWSTSTDASLLDRAPCSILVAMNAVPDG